MKHMASLLAAALLLAVAASAAHAPRPLTPGDVYRLKTVNDPELTPGGKLVVYEVTTVDAYKDKRVSHLWMVPADGKAEAKPFLGDLPARFPRWSPDGRWLAFISTGSGGQANKESLPLASTAKQQIWVVARDGQERRRITDFPNGVLRYSWSPDSRQLAVAARPDYGVNPEPGVLVSPRQPKPSLARGREQRRCAPIDVRKNPQR